jgi:hypothetical protein
VKNLRFVMITLKVNPIVLLSLEDKFEDNDNILNPYNMPIKFVGLVNP